MKLLWLPAFLLSLICTCAAPSSSSGLAVVPPSAVRWDFGTRSASDDAPLLHTFLLRNSTKAPLTIDRVAVSCDCVEAQVGDSESLPVKVAPGQTVSVQVTVSMRRFVAGPVSRTVWIYEPGAHLASVQLDIVGVVRDDAETARKPSGHQPPRK